MLQHPSYLHNQTLQSHNIHDRIVATIFLPKNLLNIFTRAAPSLPEGMTKQDFIAKLSNNKLAPLINLSRELAPKI
jgi:hypothetical protein